MLKKGYTILKWGESSQIFILRSHEGEFEVQRRRDRRKNTLKQARGFWQRCSQENRHLIQYNSRSHSLDEKQKSKGP